MAGMYIGGGRHAVQPRAGPHGRCRQAGHYTTSLRGDLLSWRLPLREGDQDVRFLGHELELAGRHGCQ